jgi:phosphohistidine phosphatase SixA
VHTILCRTLSPSLVAVAILLAACQATPQAIVVTPAPAVVNPTQTTDRTATPAAASVAQPASPPVAAPAASPAAAAPAGDCVFQFGFAAMRDLVGPSIVGECTENEREIPGNANAEQRTTNGTLVYRAIDGRVLFSNATQTWINRDGTAVARPNHQRFEWEGDRQLVETLKRGGHIIYFRHGPTDSSQRDSDPNNLANCATQRNLTDAGRAQARAIGEAFRSLDIPVGQVLSSEYCRAKEYAQLAFNKAEMMESLVLPDPLTDQEKAQNTEELKRLFGIAPQPGINTVMVSHSPNIRLAYNVDLPAEGGAAVFRVERDAAPILVARILPDEWTILSQALSAR